MNARAKLSGGGWIAVPKAVREAHGWEDGVELEFVEGADGVKIQPVEASVSHSPRLTKAEFLESRIKIDQPFPNDEEIQAALLEEAARRFDATRR